VEISGEASGKVCQSAVSVPTILLESVEVLISMKLRGHVWWSNWISIKTHQQVSSCIHSNTSQTHRHMQPTISTHKSRISTWHKSRQNTKYYEEFSVTRLCKTEEENWHKP